MTTFYDRAHSFVGKLSTFLLIKYRFLCITLILSNWLIAGTVEWDDEFTLNGEPNHRWHQKDNWSGNTLPASTDDVKLLTGSLVELFTNSAEVKTIDAKIPLKIGSTLIINSSGSFENSITVGADGVLRANGPVTFTGFNDLRFTALEGIGTFTNQGDVIIGSKGINIATTFINQLNTTLDAGTVNLGIFDNQGSFDFGERGIVNSSTQFSNSGTLQKTDIGDSSSLTGTFLQTGGKITTDEGTLLLISTDDQQYKGGQIESKGELLITGNDNDAHNRTFDGLTGITGTGIVEQVREFRLFKDLTVTMSNAPGYKAGSLIFGKASTTASFSNAGFLAIEGSPKFEPFDPDDEFTALSHTFLNTSSGKVIQDESSNPWFSVAVENAGEWTSYGMKIVDFENTGTLRLKGDQRIDPEDIPTGGNLRNLGTVRVEAGTSRFVIATEFDQGSKISTYIDNGELRLEGGSQQFAGIFEIDAEATLNISRGSYTSELRKGFFLQTTLFRGSGKAIIGGSQLLPEFHDALFQNELGLSADGNIDEAKSLDMRSGNFGGKGQILNFGYMKWGGGTVSGSISNRKRIDIIPGAPHRLEGSLSNLVPFPSPTGIIYQSTSVFISEENIDNVLSKGRITNYGEYHLLSGASIHGGGKVAFNNYGYLICEEDASVPILCELRNNGLTGKGIVEVKSGAVLGLSKCLNLSEEGELKGGKWIVAPTGQIIFETPFYLMTDNCDWTGPGARTVTSIGKSASLTKTTDEVHSVRLDVQGVISLGAGTRTTIPETELKDGGKMTGTGTHVGDVKVGSGNIAPGDSPGTLTIAGDALFTAESTYEWEASSASSSDLLEVTSGSATLAGVVKPVFIDGYVPISGESFTILNAPSLTGAFDGIDSSELPIGVTASLSYSDTSVILTVGAIALPSYADWAALRFTSEEQSDPLISGPNADPDGDGLINFQEYAHGTDPKKATVSPVQITSVGDTYIELAFNWSDTATDAVFRVQTSSELVEYGEVAHTVENAESAEGITRYTIRVPTITDNDKTFGRLLVSPVTP